MIRVYETVLYKVVSVLEIKANCISSKGKKPNFANSICYDNNLCIVL